MKSNLAIVVGTGVQEKICRKLFPAFVASPKIHNPQLLSLEQYYRLGLSLPGLGPLCSLRDFMRRPWYDRSRFQKALSLPPYLSQLLWVSRKIRNFLFFVDTGVLERSAIHFLKTIGCKVAVLQDAMKRRPLQGSQRSLTWFGGGGADLYLLTGKRYSFMVRKGSRLEIVGSPIYQKDINPLPPGKNILVVNQCFAKYGEISAAAEFQFIEEVVEAAAEYGQVELRLHPHNDRKRYQKLDRENIEVTQKKPLKKSLIDSGIVLCINSTVILEALALGRPVVTLKWHPSPFDQPISDVVTSCSDREAMCALLKKFRANQYVAGIDPESLQDVISSFIAFDGTESRDRIVSSLEAFVDEG